MLSAPQNTIHFYKYVSYEIKFHSKICLIDGTKKNPNMPNESGKH